jgi:hypothetical protein
MHDCINFDSIKNIGHLTSLIALNVNNNFVCYVCDFETNCFFFIDFTFDKCFSIGRIFDINSINDIGDHFSSLHFNISLIIQLRIVVHGRQI